MSSNGLPTHASLRRLLAAVLPSGADFEAFCVDYFPTLHAQFTPDMQRKQRVSLLLVHAEPEQILAALTDHAPEGVEEHRKILVYSTRSVPDPEAEPASKQRPPVKKAVLAGAAAAAAIEAGTTFWKGWKGALTVVSLTVLGVTIGLTVHRSSQKNTKGQVLPPTAEAAPEEEKDPPSDPRPSQPPGGAVPATAAAAPEPTGAQPGTPVLSPPATQGERPDGGPPRDKASLRGLVLAEALTGEAGGFVRDFQTGEALGGVSVTISAISFKQNYTQCEFLHQGEVFTSSDGHYKFDMKTNVAYYIYFNLAGYPPYSISQKYSVPSPPDQYIQLHHVAGKSTIQNTERQTVSVIYALSSFSELFLRSARYADAQFAEQMLHMASVRAMRVDSNKLGCQIVADIFKASDFVTKMSYDFGYQITHIMSNVHYDKRWFLLEISVPDCVDKFVPLYRYRNDEVGFLFNPFRRPNCFARFP